MPRTANPRSAPLRLTSLIASGAALLLAVTTIAGGSTHRAQPVASPERMALATTYLPTYVANYETGMRAFDNTPWNDEPYAPTLVRTPTYDGYYAGRYVIPAGGHRSENVPHLRSFREGDDYWFSWATRLGSDIQVNSSHWQVFDQWKNAGIGSPPLELKVSGGMWYLDGGYGWPGNTNAVRPRLDSRLLGRARLNVWDRWTVHIKFSSRSSTAAVSVRRNGTVVVPGWRPRGGTLYPGLTSYLKIGYYRDPSINTLGTGYQDRLKVGTTPWSVQ
jgi:hypothetical protein